MKKVKPKVKTIISKSIQKAKFYNDFEIKTEHFFISLLNDDDNNAVHHLKDYGVNINLLIATIEYYVEVNHDSVVVKDIPFSNELSVILKNSEKEANNFKSEYLETQHILLSLLKSENNITNILNGMGVDYKSLKQRIGDNTKIKDIKNSIEDMDENESKSNKGKSTEKKYSKTPILDNFSEDITKKAAEGNIDPVIGRDDIIQRVAQILSRKKKNNPVLIGEPGVGKTTIIEGLALRIQNGKAPRNLLNKRIVSLDLTSMVAGTKYRGQFEERIKGVMDEISKIDDLIIFIDELHTMVGAGNASGSMDAANVLKPALARGDIQVVGATTLDEFREGIEKDKALTRRFQQIIVEPPSEKETLEILHKVKNSYEDYHKVNYTDDAIEACVRLAQRFITDREFPDKALDILDEAGSTSQINIKTPKVIKDLEAKIEDLKNQKQEVVKSQRYEVAAELRDEEVKTVDELEKETDKWHTDIDKKRITITESDITEVVSLMTGIPISRVNEKETKRLLNMEKEMMGKVVGQDNAVVEIAKSLRRNRVGIRNPKKPIGTFMFLGPTGTGKTLLTKNLAEYLFGNEDNLIRIDMSEYMEKYTISRLIGTPPGYVGYEEGGQLTEKVRRRPYSIILFDEIEKAHKDIYNLLLQLLDDGVLTDSKGRKVNFKNCMIIMTSNVGVKKLQNFGAGVGFGTKTKQEQLKTIKDDTLKEELKKEFPPEFLNRIDDIVIFNSLTKEDMNKIVDIEFKKVINRVAEIGYNLKITPSVKDYIVEHGYDEHYGARPLTRAIQKLIEDPVSEEILRNSLELGKTIRISYSKKKDELIIKSE
jgi:ATP-dependent Clp protease ATP-binding subunit ClpC